MRRTSLLGFLVLALAGGLTPASALPQADAPADEVVESVVDSVLDVSAPGGLASDNVEYVGTIPIDSPGVSAKVRHFEDAEHGYSRLLYVNGTKGVTIYDLDNPALPVPVGHVSVPHSQNEDIQVSEDGTRATIAADGGLPVPIGYTQGLHIIDASDPTSPERVAWLDDAGGGTNHTAACADASCEWIYGNRGSIYHVPADVSSDEDIETLDREWFEHDVDGDGELEQLVSSSHALNRSVHPDPETGEPVQILISDSSPRLMMDVSDPADPVLLTTSGDTDFSDDGFLQHNNLRPNAHFWTPRDQEATAQHNERPTLPEQAHPKAQDQVAGADDDSGSGVESYDAPGNASGQRAEELPEGTPSDGVSGGDLRPGELVIGNSESNLVPGCGSDSGGLTTFSIADFDKGEPMERLHEFRPVNGDWYSEGNPPANGLGCSGHWFDIQDGDNIIAASWYEHGVKLIEIQEDYSMEQIGFFQPLGTEAGASYWVVDDDGTEYVYSTDYARGIDIIRFDRDPDLRPDDEEMEAAWRQAAGRVASFSEQERQWCRIGAR